MLHIVRTWKDSVVIKLFLGLIILSFIVWGVGDMFRIQSPSHVLSLGNSDVTVSMQHYMRTLKSEVDQFQQMMGVHLDESQIRELQIPQHVVQKLMQQALIEAASNELNLAVSEKTVIDFLKNQPFFQKEDGSFNSEKLTHFIRHQGLSEEQYLTSLKKDLREHILLKALLSVPIVPKSLLEASYKYEHEVRTADIITITKDAIEAPTTPSEKELQAFYDERKDSYIQPETRTIDYLLLDTSIIEKDIRLTQDEITEEIEQRKTEFSELSDAEAQKKASEMLLAQKAEIRLHEWSKTIDDELASGATFEEISSRSPAQLTKAVSIDFQGNSLGKKVTLPSDPAFIEHAFNTDEGSDSPLQFAGDHGYYYVIHVRNVAPAHPKAFEDVKEALKGDWIKSETSKRMEDMAVQISEKIAGGTPISDFHAKGISIQAGKRFMRTENQDKPSETADSIIKRPLFFLQKTGAITRAEWNDKDQLEIAILKEIYFPKNVKNDHLKGLDKHWSQQSSAMLMELYLRYLERKFPIELNEKVFENAG